MRYSRMDGNSGRESGGGKGALLVIVMICVAAAVYFIVAAKVGNFLSDRIITPVIAFVTGQDAAGSEESDSNDNNNAAEEDETATDELELSGLNLYALQAGVFDNEENAKELAQSLQEKGGAGYVRSGEEFRVYVSAYETEEEAENVSDRLESEQNLSCKIREISSEKLKLKITAPSAAVESAKAAFSLAGQLESKLCELSLSLDKSEISATKALESIKALSEHISSVKSDFESNTSGADSPVYSAISAYLSGAASAVDKLLENETASELSPQIKYSYIDAAFLRADMVSSIGKDV